MNPCFVASNDIVFSYKEQFFTGFAPCFQSKKYSLACCKGNRKNGGMRVSVCSQMNSKDNIGKSIWVVSIAGSLIDKNGHNTTSIEYRPNDVIYIAKINKKFTIKDYFEKYAKKRRLDAIYSWNDESKEIVWNSNATWGGRGDHDPYENGTLNEDYKKTDCSLEYPNMTQAEIFSQLEQIVMADEYYIFNHGQKICEELNIGRNYTYKKNGKEKRAEYLQDWLKEHSNSIAFSNGSVPSSPFFDASSRRGSCT